MNCVNICAICGKPVYSYESQWKNPDEFYAHDACVKALTINFTKGKIPDKRGGVPGPSPFDAAFYLIMTMAPVK